MTHGKRRTRLIVLFVLMAVLAAGRIALHLHRGSPPPATGFHASSAPAAPALHAVDHDTA